MVAFSIDQQIEEVEREIKLRGEVYPRWVGSGKMKQGVADYHMARMKAVLKTLMWLKTNKFAIEEGILRFKESAS